MWSLTSVQAYASLYLNSALNPIIYAFRSPSFREGYKEILCQTPTYVISDGKFASFSLPLSLSLSLPTTSSGSGGTLRTQVWSTPDRKWWPAAGIILKEQLRSWLSSYTVFYLKDIFSLEYYSFVKLRFAVGLVHLLVPGSRLIMRDFRKQCLGFEKIL